MRATLQFETFDGEYVRRLAEGESSAGNHFAEYFGNVLYLKLRVRLRFPDLIDDVLQTTLLRVLQILRDGEEIRRPERFGAFVNSVCNNVIREHFRAQRRYDAWDEEMPEPVDPSVDLDADLVNNDRKRLIDEILMTLSERDRRILRAIFLEETDKTELCSQFKIDQGYLRVLQHRAKAHFREAYDERNDVRPIKPSQG
jgi:RNA polymerase sigma-70 factor, ECF subfamily